MKLAKNCFVAFFGICLVTAVYPSSASSSDAGPTKACSGLKNKNTVPHADDGLPFDPEELGLVPVDEGASFSAADCPQCHVVFGNKIYRILDCYCV